ncbi:MAG: galactitol-1-phosphate 5-dehydrogenase [Acidobacteriia bacterium]|nr:galactitol-1-phosphate 5-dehydrogenase [Terriglobia bacterium]
MNALLLRDYMKLELVQMAEPAIAAGDVLVRVRACGICGSDVHGLDGATGRRIPPLVMGHEAAGEVAAVGSGVSDLRVGDRVTFDSTISCGHCPYCARGEANLCDHREVLGVSPGPYRRHGAFAEYIAVPRPIVYRLPDNLTFEQAALIEAVSVAIHAVALTPLRPQDSVAVVGSGMIGLLVVQALRHAGCARVVAIDTNEQRLRLARQLGATATANAADAGAVRDLDAAIECVGASEPVAAALACVRKGGAVTLVGNLAAHVEFPLQAVVTRQIRVQGSCASSGEYPAAMEMMATGAIQVDPLISAVAPLAEGPAWFDRLYRHEPGLMKVILRP